VDEVSTYCSSATCTSGAGPGGSACAHPICTQGPGLDPGCDACAAQVCATDSFCCDTTWDSLCVDEVGSICGQGCP
jgi:hypothetical protein